MLPSTRGSRDRVRHSWMIVFLKIHAPDQATDKAIFAPALSDKDQ